MQNKDYKVNEVKAKYLFRHSKYIKLAFLFSDIIFVNIAFFLSFYFRYGHLNYVVAKESKTVLLIVNGIWVGLVYYLGEYKFIRIEYIDKILSKSIKIILLHLFLVYTIISVLNLDDVSRLRMFYFYLVFFVEVFIFRILYLQFLKYLRKAGYNYRNIVIIGAGSVGRDMHSILAKDLALGYRINGFFCDISTSDPNIKILGGIKDALPYIKENHIHEVFFSIANISMDYAQELIRYCENNLIRVKLVPDFSNFTRSRRVHIDFYDNIPVVSLRKEPLEIPINRVVKRIFDLVFSLTIIVLVFPWLFPLIMFLIKISSKGPIFFMQQRSGENNNVFWCLKFRTMRVNLLSDELQASRNDPRITGIGKFLRRSNLDELPQFFNVLVGEMSVVGPRPHMLKHTKDYSELINTFLVRHLIRPGITGWAQINGFRGETINIDQMEKRVEYDIWYIENWSLLLDVKIIYKTLFNMVSGNKNAA